MLYTVACLVFSIKNIKAVKREPPNKHSIVRCRAGIQTGVTDSYSHQSSQNNQHIDQQSMRVRKGELELLCAPLTLHLVMMHIVIRLEIPNSAIYTTCQCFNIPENILPFDLAVCLRMMKNVLMSAVFHY